VFPNRSTHGENWLCHQSVNNPLTMGTVFAILVAAVAPNSYPRLHHLVVRRRAFLDRVFYLSVRFGDSGVRSGFVVTVKSCDS